MFRHIKQLSIVGIVATIALGAAGEQPRGAVEFFHAQQRAHEKHADVKEASRKARGARQALEKKREERRKKNAAGGEKRREKKGAAAVLNVTKEEASQEKLRRDAQRAEEAAEIAAEFEQIAVEEVVLTKVLQENPTLADTVAAQRKEIVVRKRMLELRQRALGQAVFKTE